MSRVLVVDDEPGVRLALRENFVRCGWEVQTASGVQEALDRFRSAPFPLVITDMKMPDGDGLAVLRGVHILAPNTAVIFLAGFGTVCEAVAAMKAGAVDYFVKPIAFQRLEEAARRALSMAPGESARPAAAAGIVGESVSMTRLMERARQVARTDVDVLLEAESGTGKELFARLIHLASSQRRGAFVAINCAACPSTLIESELFGYVKGAFTGAYSLHAGKFELANGGTLLLDEIGEMPLEQQPKLLRVLQQREVYRLGDRRPVGVDVRVVATTNGNLERMVAEGKFRADLYYRLNVVTLHIPPLRERKEEIPPLVEHFITKYSSPGRPVCFSGDLMGRLLAYDWPGNVRELENIVRRILALATGPEATAELLEGTSLGTSLNEPVSAFLPEEHVCTLRDMERHIYRKALEHTNGNRTRAAELLGVSVRTVRNKIRAFDIRPRNFV